jgi:hypothetical protein
VLRNNTFGLLMVNAISILLRARAHRIFFSVSMKGLPYLPVSLQSPVAVSVFRIRLVKREISNV